MCHRDKRLVAFNSTKFALTKSNMRFIPNLSSGQIILDYGCHINFYPGDLELYTLSY